MNEPLEAPENRTPHAKVDAATPACQSRFDSYMEDAIPILHAGRKLKLFAARMVGYVAVVYGIWPLSASSLVLGLIVLGFFWAVDRRPAAPPEDMQRASTPADDSPPAEHERC